MKLIDILVQELPVRGGWPEFALALTQDGDGSICLWEDVDVYQQGGAWAHPSGTGLLKYWCNNQAMKPAEDRSKAIITREQYDAALAASKTEWDGRGLPPSGVEFEYLRGEFGADEGRWVKCVMKYAGERFCIVHLKGEGESWLKHEGTKIRPIRSEADKKRDASIQEMIELIDHLVGDQANPVHGKKAVAEKFYDAIAAGKIPHIRID